MTESGRFAFTLQGCWGHDPVDERLIVERIHLPSGWIESSNPFLGLFLPEFGEGTHWLALPIDLAREIARGFDLISDDRLNWFLCQQSVDK